MSMCVHTAKSGLTTVSMLTTAISGLEWTTLTYLAADAASVNWGFLFLLWYLQIPNIRHFINTECRSAISNRLQNDTNCIGSLLVSV
jgi:hypothetical protein